MISAAFCLASRSSTSTCRLSRQEAIVFTRPLSSAVSRASFKTSAASGVPILASPFAMYSRSYPGRLRSVIPAFNSSRADGEPVAASARSANPRSPGPSFASFKRGGTAASPISPRPSMAACADEKSCPSRYARMISRSGSIASVHFIFPRAFAAHWTT